MSEQKVFELHLVSIVTKKQGESRVTWGCNHEAFSFFDEIIDVEIPLVFWLEGCETQKINCSLTALSSRNSSGDANRKIVIDVPESERRNIAELSMLVGKVVKTIFVFGS